MLTSLMGEMQLLVTLGFVTSRSTPMGGGTPYPSSRLCASVFKTNGSMCCLCFLNSLDGGVVHGLPHAARGWRANFSCRTLSAAFCFTCGLVANQQLGALQRGTQLSIQKDTAGIDLDITKGGCPWEMVFGNKPPSQPAVSAPLGASCFKEKMAYVGYGRPQAVSVSGSVPDSSEMLW